LLNAFSRSSFKITGTITKEAIHELNQAKPDIGAGRKHIPAYLATTAIILVLLGGVLYLRVSENSLLTAASKTNSMSKTAATSKDIQPEPKELQPAADAAAVSSLEQPESSESMGENQQDAGIKPDPKLSPAVSPLPEIEPARETQTTVATAESFIPEVPGSNAAADTSAATAAERFLQYLKSLNSRHSRNTSIEQAVKLWSSEAVISEQTLKIESDKMFFREAAAENQLQVQPLASDADFSLLQALNLPALLTFYLPNHAWPQYLTLAGLDEKNAYLDAGDQGDIVVVDKDILLRFWSGEAYIVWKNFLDLDGIIAAGSHPEAINHLKKLLLDLDFAVKADTDEYDTATRQTIKDIQLKYGLEVDGIVGPFTKIALYNEGSDFSKPSLDNSDNLVKNSTPPGDMP